MKAYVHLIQKLTWGDKSFFIDVDQIKYVEYDHATAYLVMAYANRLISGFMNEVFNFDAFMFSIQKRTFQTIWMEDEMYEEVELETPIQE